MTMNFTNLTPAEVSHLYYAKIISGIVLFAATVIATLTPTCLVRRTVTNSRVINDPSRSRHCAWKKHLLSAFNCFAGGVFISTGLLHVYVDAEEDVKDGLKAHGIDTEFPVTMFIMLCGIFLLLIIEKSADYLASFRRVDPTMEPLLNSSSYRHYNVEVAKNSPISIVQQDSRSHSAFEETFEAALSSSHSNFINPHSPIQSIVLAVALSIHSVFEGLALGLQHTVSETYKILLVICLHKLVIAFSLGINLGMASIRIWLLILIAAIFALASPIGTFLGAGISMASDMQHGLAVGILQSMACGTFVYVTFFEILPREFNKRDCIRSLYILCLLVGFGGVALYNFLQGDPDGHHHDEKMVHKEAI